MNSSIVIGTKVKLNNTSTFYSWTKYDPTNPTDIQGVVTDIKDCGYGNEDLLNIDVSWANGEANAYTKDDLIILPDTRSSKGNKTLKKSDIYKLGMMMYHRGQVEDKQTSHTTLEVFMDEILKGIHDEP